MMTLIKTDEKTGIRAKGGSGPSGLHADGRRKMIVLSL